MKMTTQEIYYLSGVIDTLPKKARGLLYKLLEQVREEQPMLEGFEFEFKPKGNE